MTAIDRTFQAISSADRIPEKKKKKKVGFSLLMDAFI